MYYEDLYSIKGLPNPLPEQELMDCFKAYQNGDHNAREKIILHNIKLVFSVVNQKFKRTPYDEMELIQIGIIGLMKSIDHYNLSKKIKFSTFAVSCISNEIGMFLRKRKKMDKDISLETIISYDDEGHVLTIEDTLFEEEPDIILDISIQARNKIIRECVEKLPERERQMVQMNFGLIGGHPISQNKIAKKFQISQSYVSRILKRQYEIIRHRLEISGNVEMSDCQKIKKKEK